MKGNNFRPLLLSLAPPPLPALEIALQALSSYTSPFFSPLILCIITITITNINIITLLHSKPSL